MVNNGNREAFADQHGGGLTKREYIASQILSGLAVREGWGDDTIENAVCMADQLLLQLDKP